MECDNNSEEGRCADEKAIKEQEEMRDAAEDNKKARIFRDPES